MDEIRRILVDLDNRLQKIERGLTIKDIVIPSGGSFIPPQLSADPSGGALIEGMVWENTTTHHLKMYLNGAITTII